jgi:hypothetical protein
MSTKESWPEVVGKTGEEAKEIISKDTAGKIEVHVVPQLSPCTMDYRTDRCRVFVDDNNKVVHPPCLG